MAVYRIMAFAIAVLCGGYICYFIIRTMRFWGLEIRKKFSRFAIAVLSIIAMYVCQTVWRMGAMIVLHLIAISILIDILWWLLESVFRKKSSYKGMAIGRKLYGCGIIPIVVTAILFAYGFWNMNYVVRTEYDVATDKNIGNYKIMLITDTHYDTIQDTKVLKENVDKMNAENPDIVILGGDMVEENTSKEAMQEVFQILGKLESTYGIYYVYGNHDRQPYTESPSYTDEELENAILENGITILEDDYKVINEELILAGRADAAWGNSSNRASVEEILSDVNREKYIIMADHQPIEAEENNAQGVDLELSGHTHAGQLWPVGIFTELTGGFNYGEYQKENCTVIVSSGFTGWGYPIRTEEHCEYVVINVNGKMMSR